MNKEELFTAIEEQMIDIAYENSDFVCEKCLDTIKETECKVLRNSAGKHKIIVS